MTLLDKVKQLESQKLRVAEDADRKYKDVVLKLEEELEAKE